MLSKGNIINNKIWEKNMREVNMITESKAETAGAGW
jgi:hypothetical protein